MLVRETLRCSGVSRACVFAVRAKRVTRDPLDTLLVMPGVCARCCLIGAGLALLLVPGWRELARGLRRANAVGVGFPPSRSTRRTNPGRSELSCADTRSLPASHVSPSVPLMPLLVIAPNGFTGGTWNTADCVNS